MLSLGGLTGDDLANNKDFLATQALINSLRKPLFEFDSTLGDADLASLVLSQDQRKKIIEKAMVETVKEIAKVRNTHMKIQQVYLEIDESNVDGKGIAENEMILLDLPKEVIARNLKLSSISNQIKAKFGDYNDVDVDQISVDSNEMVPTQEDVELVGEDIDGLPLSDSDSLLVNAGEQETIEVTIGSEKLKAALKQARKKIIAHNKEQILAQKRKAEHALLLQRLEEEQKAEVPLTVEEALNQVQAQLKAEKKEFRRVYDTLDKKTGAFDRLVKFRKRLDKDIEYFVREL